MADKHSHKRVCSRDYVLYFSPFPRHTQRLFSVLTYKVIENFRHILAMSMLQSITGQQRQPQMDVQSNLHWRQWKIKLSSVGQGQQAWCLASLNHSPCLKLSGKTEMLKFKKDSSSTWSAEERIMAGGSCSVQREHPIPTPAQHCRAAARPLQHGEASALLVSIAKRTRGKVESGYCDCAMRTRKSKPNLVISLFLFLHLEGIISVSDPEAGHSQPLRMGRI